MPGRLWLLGCSPHFLKGMWNASHTTSLTTHDSQGGFKPNLGFGRGDCGTLASDKGLISYSSHSRN